MGGSRNFPAGLDIAFWIVDFCLRNYGKSGSGGLHAVVWSWCQDSDGIFPDGVCIWKPDRTVLLIGVITATVLVYEAAEEKLPDWVRVCGLGIYSLFGMYVMTMQIVALWLA